MLGTAIHIPHIIQNMYYITDIKLKDMAIMDCLACSKYSTTDEQLRDFPGGLDSKESTCNVGDLDSIPGSGRSLGEGNGNNSSIIAWRIPWTEEPIRLQSFGLQRVGHD